MERIEYDDYVFITKGKHKGKFGYYDDDCGPKTIFVIINENYPEVIDEVIVRRDAVIKMNRDFMGQWIDSYIKVQEQTKKETKEKIK